MEIPVVKLDGTLDHQLDVADAVFAEEFKEPLIHQVVTAYLASGRAGTSSQKNRSDVRGGGSKPWRQKGTGRARAGTIRSPLWRGGGRAFASGNQSYAQKVNRKMYRVAVRSILSELVRQERLKVCDEIYLDQPKTQMLVAVLVRLGVEGRVLIVTAEHNQNLTLSARNMRDVEVQDVARLNPVGLVGSETVLVASEALRKMENLLR